MLLEKIDGGVAVAGYRCTAGLVGSPSASTAAHRRDLGFGASYRGCEAVHEMVNSAVRHSINAQAW